MPSRLRCLGLDVGDRRIGVAVSDETGRLARPVTVLRRGDTAADAAAVAGLARELGAGLVVVGVPLNMDGSLGEQARKSLAFAGALRERGLTVAVWDERLTTRQAHDVLRTTGAPRRVRRARRDAVAAALILQGFLDRRRTDSETGREAAAGEENGVGRDGKGATSEGDGAGGDGPGSP